MKNYYIIFYIFLLTTNLNFAQQNDSLTKNTQLFRINDQLTFEYIKPKFFDMFKHIPKDIIGFGKYITQKENMAQVGASVISTVIIIPFDQSLTDEAQHIGSKIGWDNEGTYLRIKGVRMFPSNLSAAAYYIGNGGTTLLLGGGFFIYGKINNDYRALNTSSELVEVLLSTGVVTQVIKRMTGRQSPNIENEANWTPFPSFNAYQTNTPNYDAMPSGHLATFMASLTVIATNYPEKKWIKPIGYTLIGALAFQMANSRVHWVSDYPIGILIGYIIGKNAAKRRIKEYHQIKIGSQEINFKTNYNVSNLNGDMVIGIKFTF